MTTLSIRPKFQGFGPPRLQHVRATKSSPEPPGSRSTPSGNVSFADKVSLIGQFTKEAELKAKDLAREEHQYGQIPPGPLKDRTDRAVDKLQKLPFPVDVVDADIWASAKNLPPKYIRSLIKSQEGALPLLGGSVQYSAAALESLYRADVLHRRQKGLKRAATARFKAERLKLALAELEAREARDRGETPGETPKGPPIDPEVNRLRQRLAHVTEEILKLKEEVRMSGVEGLEEAILAEGSNLEEDSIDVQAREVAQPSDKSTSQKKN